MNENVDNTVIQHLLFHKALIDEQDDAERINYYVDLLSKTNEGLHLSMDNPFDRSIAMAFELVMQQHLNPWDLDLVSFSTMYLQRAKKDHIDLITAGRIILMAWKVLKLQSNDLMIHLQNETTEEISDWDELSSEMWFTTEDEYSYTNLLMNLPDPPLEEPIRRHTKRKVTLIELLEAFDLARKEAEEFQRNEKRRQEARQKLFEASRKRMIGTAHDDNIEADVNEIWAKICASGKDQLSINDLCDGNNREEIIKTFISVLFLANENKITVFQRKFPYGKIFIKTLGCT
jgi:segregation and condensation protein A